MSQDRKGKNVGMEWYLNEAFHFPIFERSRLYPYKKKKNAWHRSHLENRSLSLRSEVEKHPPFNFTFFILFFNPFISHGNFWSTQGLKGSRLSLLVPRWCCVAKCCHPGVQRAAAAGQRTICGSQACCWDTSKTWPAPMNCMRKGLHTRQAL